MMQGTKPITIVANNSGDKPMQRYIVTPTMSSEQSPQVHISPAQTHISFQVPLNWAGPGKSLIDPNKMSLVNINSPDTGGRSLLQGVNTDGTSLSVKSPDSGMSGKQMQGASVLNIPKVTTVPTLQQIRPGTTFPQKVILQSRNSMLSSTVASPNPNASKQPYLAGKKVYSNLASGHVITQCPTGVIMVTRPTVTLAPPTAKVTNKGTCSLVMNKTHTIVQGANNTAVQIMSKDLSGKVAMNEAQIMLPSGPKKIAVHYQVGTTSAMVDNKPILVKSQSLMKTSPFNVVQGKSVIQPKPANSPQTSPTEVKSTISLTPTAKVVDVISPSKSLMKTTVMQSQKNWELVKQSNQLIGQSNNTSTYSHFSNIDQKPQDGAENGPTESDNKSRKLSGDGNSQSANDANKDSSTPSAAVNENSQTQSTPNKNNDGTAMEVENVDGTKVKDMDYNDDGSLATVARQEGDGGAHNGEQVTEDTDRVVEDNQLLVGNVYNLL